MKHYPMTQNDVIYKKSMLTIISLTGGILMYFLTVLISIFYLFFKQNYKINKTKVTYEPGSFPHKKLKRMFYYKKDFNFILHKNSDT